MTVYTARLTDGTTAHLLSRDAAYGQVCIRCGHVPDGSEQAGTVVNPSPDTAVGYPVLRCWPECPTVAQGGVGTPRGSGGRSHLPAGPSGVARSHPAGAGAPDGPAPAHKKPAA